MEPAVTEPTPINETTRPIDPAIRAAVESHYAQSPPAAAELIERFARENDVLLKETIMRASGAGHDTLGVNHEVFEAAVEQEARLIQAERSSRESAA